MENSLGTKARRGTSGARYVLVATLMVVGAFVAAAVAMAGATKAGAETNFSRSGTYGEAVTPITLADGDSSSFHTDDGRIRWEHTTVSRARGAYYSRPQSVEVIFWVDRWVPGTGWQEYTFRRREADIGFNERARVGGQYALVPNRGDYYRVEIWVRWKDNWSGRIIGTRKYLEDHPSDYGCVDYAGKTPTTPLA